ncbi:nucleotidyltransferase domain-containing protein [Thiococcus pfennigii]|uniref:nucleotidyltransferase domain-containing protein n=1 Tax=Thiococcus pfennigii TaxID=1057 RepID=UPI0019081E27|nr:nucleotidyltransferase domain-containing protein [Thiococcus pfennigii]
MRLTKDQIAAILEVNTGIAGRGAAVLLFGSCLDDAARGGDVDLVIETEAGLSVRQRAELRTRLEARRGCRWTSSPWRAGRRSGPSSPSRDPAPCASRLPREIG